MLLAWAGIRLLARLAPEDVPRVAQAAMDPLVLAFGIALVIVTVLLFGVAPAFLAFRHDPQAALQEAGRGSTGSAHPVLRRLLIAAEGALSAFLLAGGGMLVHSFLNMTAVDPGFRAGHVLTFRVTTELDPQESRRALYAAILERVRALPGVESAAAVLVRPLSGAVGWDTVYSVEGAPLGRPNENPNGNYEAISPEYFRTMGIALVAGRDFNAGDTVKAPGVVIVDEATARRHWPAGEAVGKRIRLGANSRVPYLTVVGVVKPVRYREWQAPWPDLYVPYTQRAQFRSDFVVKTAGNPADLVAAVRREVMAIDRNQPISSVATMEALVGSALSGSRFNGVVMAVVAGCALLLAAIGIYAVLSYTVTQRRAEIGVRMAMGASPRSVAVLVTREGMAPVLCGMVIGLVLAVWVRGLLKVLLFGIAGLDVMAYGGAAALLALVAAAACAAPAWHAASIDPARTLAAR
jgi:predicted permease